VRFSSSTALLLQYDVLCRGLDPFTVSRDEFLILSGRRPHVWLGVPLKSSGCKDWAPGLATDRNVEEVNTAVP